MLEAMRRMSQTAQTGYRMTLREQQILRQIVAGCTNKEISEKFFISEETVKHHLTNLFEKLGVTNRLELAIFAISNKLLPKD